MKLIFGVVDVAYAGANGKEGTDTTGDVAEILEKKYHVMGTFYEAKQEQIANALVDGISGEIENLFLGKRAATNPFLGAEQQISKLFRKFLDAGEMSMIVAGLSEGESAAFNWKGTFDSAGKRGVSHRKKEPDAIRSARPAFIDTGLYQASFYAEVEK